MQSSTRKSTARFAIFSLHCGAVTEQKALPWAIRLFLYAGNSCTISMDLLHGVEEIVGPISAMTHNSPLRYATAR